MTDYENSYSSSSDFKRTKAEIKLDCHDEDAVRTDESEEIDPTKNTEYVRELLAEKITLENSRHPHTMRLLDQEVLKAQQIGKAKEMKFVDIYREKPVKVSVKVLVPVREHPRFNFVGKLLGPKGNSMKRLQEETMCKMAVLGRGSMKDRAKEEELRQSLDPKFAHLSDDLHVEISAIGPPAEAHARVSYALAEVRKYLIPDNNDVIRQEQMREMEIISTIDPNTGEEIKSIPPRGIVKHRVAAAGIAATLPPPPAVPRGVTPYPQPSIPAVRAAAPRQTVVAAPAVTASASVSGGPPRSVVPAKTKILSILDRARVAMEESYSPSTAGAIYEDPYEAVVSSRERAYVEYVPATSPYPSSRHYETAYETEYYPAPTSRHHVTAVADPYEAYEYGAKPPAEGSSRSWKSYKTSTTAASGGSSSSSRHHESSSARYRTSPYSRPAK